MKDFTPTPYTLECVATGREFEDTGWMLADPQCKTPSLVRAKYARRQLEVKPDEYGFYKSPLKAPASMPRAVRRTSPAATAWPRRFFRP